MSVLNNCHLLCASGAVNSVPIRDGVQLDRFWLPSLLHVHTRKTPADELEKENIKNQDLTSDPRRQLTDAEKRRWNHELGPAGILLNGWM